MEQLISKIIFETKNINSTDKLKIKNQALKKNIFYTIYGLNLYSDLLWNAKYTTINFNNINLISKEIGDIVISSYLVEYKKLLHTTFAHEFNLLVDNDFIDNDYSVFIEDISNDIEWIEYFFTKYPVILSNFEKMLDHAISFAIEFLYRLDKDINDIEAKFNIQLDDFKSFNVFSGDNHNNWRSVTKLVFSNKTIYYKPRNLYAEEITYDLFDFLQNLGLKKSVYVPSTISKNEYGWMEGVDFEEVNSESELNEFYFNQGVNLAVFYILGASDLISDNVIAHGKLPCYFDLECIFHPNLEENNTLSNYENSCLASQFIQNSILKSNILPKIGFVTNEFLGFSNSALSRIDTLIPEFVITEGNGKLIRKYKLLEFISENDHIPTYKENKTDSVKFIDDVIHGFIHGYDIIYANAKEVSDFFAFNFSGIKTRVLYRPTYIYSKIYSESFLPSYLSNVEDRDMFFESLRNLESNALNNRPIISSEISQLKNLDIPIFYTYTDSNSIYSDKNELVVSEFFKESSITSSFRKINNMSEEDKLRQLELIKMSFCLHEGYEIKKDFFKSANLNFQNLDLEKENYTVNSITEEICNIYDSIKEKSFYENGEYSFWEITQTPSYTWGIDSLRWDLFYGLDGLCFFNLNLFKVCNNHEALEAGKYLINKGLYQFLNSNDYYDVYNGVNKISLFNYPISTFYVAEYYVQDGIEIENLSKISIEKILDWIEMYYERDTEFDIMDGGAGAIIYLLKLYDRLKEERILDLCKRVADHLVKNAHEIDSDQMCWVLFNDKAHLGFSHGSSGIAYSLFKLDNYRKNSDYRNIAIKALNYERSLFDNIKNVWPAFTFSKTKEVDTLERHYWAYGSTSILASRLLISEFYMDDLMSLEIEKAVDNIISKDSPQRHHYSAGLFGNIDILNSYYISRKDDVSRNKLIQFVNTMINEKQQQNSIWACFDYGKGYSSTSDGIGLFCGISGIGNTLLNLHAPTEVNNLYR